MSSVNKCLFLGYVGQDPEITDKYAKFSLGCTEKWKDQSGQYQSKTEWIDCIVFGKPISIVDRFVKKGSQIHVEGKLTSNIWTKKDGTKTKSTSVAVQNITLIGGGSNQGSSNYGQQEEQQGETPKKKAGRPSNKERYGEEDSGDVPF